MIEPERSTRVGGEAGPENNIPRAHRVNATVRQIALTVDQLMQSPASDMTHRRRWWSRLKLVAGLATFVLICVSISGTAIAMFRSFRSIATGNEAPPPEELSHSIESALALTMTLMPFTLLSMAVWFIAWLRLRDIRLLESRDERLRK